MDLRAQLRRRARALGERTLDAVQQRLPAPVERGLDALHTHLHPHLPPRLAGALDLLRGDRIEPWDDARRFRFRCHLGVACLNSCCVDPHITLNPYDVLRLRHALGCTGEELLARHARIQILERSGLPVVWLRMDEAAGNRCHWAGARGCEVYPDRPGVCRAFPLGRTSYLDAEGQAREELVLQRDRNCRGFAERGSWTPRSYFDSQGLDAHYLDFAVRYTSLFSRVRGQGLVLNPTQQEIWLTGLYRIERFREWIEARKLLIRHRLSTAQRRAIRADDAACLAFAFDWVESVLLAGGRSAWGGWSLT